MEIYRQVPKAPRRKPSIDIAEVTAEKIAGEIKSVIADFLRNDPIRQLEEIRDSLDPASEIAPMVSDLLEQLKRAGTSRNSDEIWDYVNWFIHKWLLGFCQSSFSHFMYLGILDAYFGYGPTDEAYRMKVSKAHGMPPGKFQEALVKSLRVAIFPKVKRGGSSRKWTSERLRDLSTMYDECLEILDRAEDEKRIIMKRLKRSRATRIEEIAVKEVLDLYPIPERILNRRVSKWSRKAAAIEWVVEKMGNEFTFGAIDEALRLARTQPRLEPHGTTPPPLRSPEGALRYTPLPFQLHNMWADRDEYLSRRSAELHRLLKDSG